MSDTTTSTYQNYAMYRTTAYKGQPAGYVISAQMLTDPKKVTLPSGFAYVADPDSKYPPGSTYPVPSVAYTLTGAATATIATPLTLDLTPDNYGPEAETVVTLSDGGAGGTFSSGTVTFAAGVATTQTVTYTPKAAGTVTISATNSGSLTNPGSLSVTVSAATTATT